MSETILTFLAFLVERQDLITAIYTAVTQGVDDKLLIKLIRDAMVAASDAEMKHELMG